MTARQATLRDVAQLTGFHVSTVSRVLRGDAARISPETIASVEAAAADVGYRVNRWAASLRSGRTGIVGVLVPRITDIVLATVFEAIQREAAGHGIQAVVNSTWDVIDDRNARIENYRAERVDGLIVADARLVDPYLRGLYDEGFPLVLVSRGSRGLPSVTGDDRTGGALAAAHLVDRGCRRLAVLAGPSYATTAAHRSAGFRAEAARRGVPVDTTFVVHSGFDVAGGRQGMTELLTRGRPDGVFAVNDFSAIGAMGVLRERGLAVGEDIAVVGYNDMPISAELSVPLSSVRVDLEQMGVAAFAALNEVLGGRQASSTRLRPVLMPRASSGSTATS
ncbi:LacI family DNA-binding transcriptional regulator [Nakamurella flavida]|uniref:LacI family DNA-binding transcriptional regulator n=1 Tax=Nakamurella flavida TaxID=363630 RepID=A0A939C1T4_9ACTN|nr:LacI family DNA-binding transcriptional regulator [Nakamurella flavida]MBM9475336.1 LacI family DNA-binding transcriptional regulator [Nakamurella flavida]MDP9776910.1 LacI family transcriptional regulator [Nakamurella flavida]